MPFESPHVVGDTVEAMEFSHLAYQCSVMGVPRAMITEKEHIESALPEAQFLGQIVDAVVQKRE